MTKVHSQWFPYCLQLGVNNCADHSFGTQQVKASLCSEWARSRGADARSEEQSQRKWRESPTPRHGEEEQDQNLRGHTTHRSPGRASEEAAWMTRSVCLRDGDEDEMVRNEERSGERASPAFVEIREERGLKEEVMTGKRRGPM